MPAIPKTISLTDELIYVSCRLPAHMVKLIDTIARRDLKTRSAVMRDILVKDFEESGLVKRTEKVVA